MDVTVGDPATGSFSVKPGPTTEPSPRTRVLWLIWMAVVGAGAVVFLGWSAWSLALPGSRHPIVLTAAAFAAAPVALLLLRIGGGLIQWRTKGTVRPTAGRVALAVLLLGLLTAVFGSTDVLLRIKIRQNEPELNAAASTALANPPSSTFAPVSYTLPGCAASPARFVTIGPFRYEGCPRIDAHAQGREVFFWDWGSPEGLSAPHPFGLVYSPDGAPTVDEEACLNELTDGWYEVWEPRNDPDCPFGLSHPSS